MKVTIKDNRTYYDDKNQGQATQGEKELMAAVLDYENSITWQTSCLNCAKLMDKNYEQYVEIQELKEALNYVRVTLEDPGDYLSLDVSMMLREVKKALEKGVDGN